MFFLTSEDKEKIRKYRRHHRLSSKGLAVQCNLAEATIHRIMKPSYKASAETIATIERSTGLRFTLKGQA